MIKSEYLGNLLSDIPDEDFEEPFETWSGQLPALVLASTRVVPNRANCQWRLASTSCGGHRKYTFPAAVMLLDICEEMTNVVSEIANSAFTDEYLGYFEYLSETEQRSILSDYSRYLESVGLTCSDVNLELFSQDLYPLDATPANLSRLSSSASEDELDAYSDSLVMFIIGPS
ncbi:hypothetical protein Q9F19_004382 [Salmonella enterica subsp. enterica serovar Rubislaw]|nr:hypothetical protein [Salmonella enterica subsp. enterica serovar Rubislaw]